MSGTLIFVPPPPFQSIYLKLETEEKKMRLAKKYAVNEKFTIFTKLL